MFFYTRYRYSLLATFLSLFGNGFLVLGVLTAVGGIVSLFQGSGEEALGLILVGAVFGGGGYGLRRLAEKRGQKKAAEVEANYERGCEAYKAKNYTLAFTCFKQAAEKLHPSAMNYLGHMYGAGLGVPRDDAEALKRFKSAAAQGSVSAMHNLGLFYENGRGTQPNTKEAIKWYKKAAAKGFSASAEKLKQLQ